ncbi:MAG: phosphoribosylformylglycinamidine synthase subunit PurQ [Armatimonadetes bacterium]|nr:phosphoribosylformylglycinamidine synthase subunit PurQ [Armatimonadota bacterium]
MNPVKATKFGVVVFPGSNCDRDCIHVTEDVIGQPTRVIWHGDTDLGDVDCVVLPGGFSYGDYLRTGAIARFSPVMKAVQEFAAKGGLVLGICNGFQILCEAHLLPGALTTNTGLRFLCKYVHIRVEETDTPFTHMYEKGQILHLPIAHHGGRFFADESTVDRLESNRQVILRYCDAEGRVTEAANPNGSIRNIAGICNEARNVCGLMPHPERAAEPLLNSIDGRRMFESLVG